MRTIKDENGQIINAGDTVCFVYGIPGRYVEAKVVKRKGKLIALTPGHDPEEETLASVARNYSFWKKESGVSTSG